MTGAAPVAPGDVLAGKYRVDRVLGAGGMGVVVAAEHLDLRTRVALKFLLPAAMAQPQSVARFLREARAAASIRSEHVARVLDVGQLADGAPYMVMEYLDGMDLGEVLKQRGPLPIVTTIDYVLQACEAIAEAHSIGIVHRDLKPPNLFLTRRADGSACVKVLDFGISKVTGAEGQGPEALTGTSAILGSPYYMSPEQLRSTKHVDARADVWSLGVILHELVTGQKVFQADTLAGLVATIAADPPPPLRAHRPDAPAALEAVVLRCLEKHWAQRFPDVAALASALAPFAGPEGRMSADRIVRLGRGGAASALTGPAPTIVMSAEAAPVAPTPAPGPGGSYRPPPAPSGSVPASSQPFASGSIPSGSTAGASWVAGPAPAAPAAQSPLRMVIALSSIGALLLAGVALVLVVRGRDPVPTGPQAAASPAVAERASGSASAPQVSPVPSAAPVVSIVEPAASAPSAGRAEPAPVTSPSGQARVTSKGRQAPSHGAPAGPSTAKSVTPSPRPPGADVLDDQR